MLEALRQLRVNAVPLEELFAAQIFAHDLQAKFAESGAEIPEWIQDKIRLVDMAIREKLADQKAGRIATLERKIQGLMSRDEQRAEAEKELRKLLGQPEPAVVETK